jgi:hypothetical protein
MRPALLRWQYEGYPQYHKDPANLWLHLFAVPGFQLSTAGVVFCAWQGSWLGIAVSLLGMALSFGAQGIGHGRETAPSIPFDGPVDALTRIFVEQFVTFPRFALSGGWRLALRGDRAS